MFSSIRAERIKMRHLRLPFLAAGTGAGLVAMIWLILQGALARLSHEQQPETPWQNVVIGDFTALIVLLLPTLVILVTALSFFVEHRNNMWKQIRTAPVPIASVYSAKFLLVQATVALGLVTAFVCAVIGWEMMPLSANDVLPVSNIEVWKSLAMITAELYLSLLPLAVIQFVLSARISNVLYPVGIGLALAFANLFLTGQSTAMWFPYAYPGAVVMSRFGLAHDQSSEDQQTDTRYRAPTAAFGVSTGEHKTMVVDAAHHNRHIIGNPNAPGSLSWMIRPAEEARITLMEINDSITERTLKPAQLLVIAGVSSTEGDGAINQTERRAIVDWVKNGGSLLLLTDHDPFSRPLAGLAEDFGAHSTIDVVSDPAFVDPRATTSARIVFTRSNGLLRTHEMTTGVRTVITYGGQGVWRDTPGTSTILALPPSARTLAGADIAHGKSSDAAQLIAFDFGKGRVIVSGETALFTAQTKSDGSSIGVGDPQADNGTLAINSIKWLLRQ